MDCISIVINGLSIKASSLSLCFVLKRTLTMGLVARDTTNQGETKNYLHETFISWLLKEGTIYHLLIVFMHILCVVITLNIRM